MASELSPGSAVSGRSNAWCYHYDDEKREGVINAWCYHYVVLLGVSVTDIDN